MLLKRQRGKFNQPSQTVQRKFKTRAQGVRWARQGLTFEARTDHTASISIVLFRMGDCNQQRPQDAKLGNPKSSRTSEVPLFHILCSYYMYV